MGYPETFTGYMVNDHKTWTQFHKKEFKPKKFEEYDIDIAIDCCGVCGSDVHTINGGWGDAPLPFAVGHEVVGKAIKVGPKVKSVKIGDRVGVGAQVSACLECKLCKADNENYCPQQIDTYGAPYPDGTLSQGGYSSHIRCHEYFVFPIPDNIPSELAAPMLCAGLTSYSPLVRAGVGPGKHVAVVGLGGLGMFGVMWANALGAEVSVISHSPNKKEDALKLGAKNFIISSEKDWAKPYAHTFDFILNTADMTHKFNLQEYMSTLAVNAPFHNVGMPDEPLPKIMAQDFMGSGGAISGSHIGCRPEALEMLKLASQSKLFPMVETIPISEKGCAEAVTRVSDNKVRYRFTLTNYDAAFGANRS